MRQLLLKILPAGFISFYKRYKKILRKKHRDELERNDKIISGEQIESILISNGIKKGDVVMLHSALSKMGYVKGGAHSVIQAFLNVIGNEGTLVMPSFPAIGYNYDYLNTDPVFDIKKTPSKMGVITETFRNMPGVVRSFHPTDPVCAFGPQAVELTRSHFGQLTPYNSESPFYKLCLLNAKIVLIGVELDSLTNLHTLEDAVLDFKYPVYHSKLFECKMINERGEMLVMKTKSHDPKWSKKRKCNDLKPLFKSAGFLTEARVGEANMIIIKAKEMHEWMVKNYIEKGITMYTPNVEKA